MTLSIMAEHCYAMCTLCWLSRMLGVTNKPLMLSVNMLNVIMLIVVMLVVVMLVVVMVSVLALTNQSFGSSFFSLSSSFYWLFSLPFYLSIKEESYCWSSELFCRNNFVLNEQQSHFSSFYFKFKTSFSQNFLEVSRPMISCLLFLY
jgi:hypothetical protein